MNELIVLVVSIVIVLAVLMAIREVMLWYFKINDQIALQKRTVELLEKILGEEPQ